MKSPRHQMKSSKLQTPNTRETSNTKGQETSLVVDGMAMDWELHDEALVLKDDQSGISGRPHPFDLEERTAVFGEKIVRFSKRIPRDPTNDRLIDQLVGAGTSVGANYCEANDCVSKK